ncbi:MAG: Fe-S cluster assembly ATPase SufC [Actinomycetaceae bacterium]|nr:Fe-S cluster assembly ATPase SufC [Actinomycetaceae bacterium]
MATLEIKDLHASVVTPEGDKPILHGVNLTIGEGEIHAIMGPNGSGKSTTAYTLAGHPRYKITQGAILLNGEDITDASPDERARMGLFLAMQYPVDVPGVSVTNFLRTAKTAIDGKAPKLRQWTKDVKQAAENLKMDSDFISRDLNVGFSGGEKKRTEVLQMQLLEPQMAILDEPDSGLDVDALKVVSQGVMDVHERTNNSLLVITHYSRILRYIKPDYVHVFADGRIIKTGDHSMAIEIDKNGYDVYMKGLSQ